MNPSHWFLNADFYACIPYCSASLVNLDLAAPVWTRVERAPLNELAMVPATVSAPPSLKPPSKEYLERMGREPSKEYLAGGGSRPSSATPSPSGTLLRNSVPVSPGGSLLRPSVTAEVESALILSTQQWLDAPKQAAPTTKHIPPSTAPVVDLQAWQAKGLAADWTLADVLGNDIVVFLLLAVLPMLVLACISAEPPAPFECAWRWKTFRCSTDCKLRMHMPLLEGSCMPK